MRKSWIIGLAVLAGTSYAAAQTDTSPPPTVTTQPASPPGAAVDTRPWIKAQALLKAVAADVRSNGIRAVEAHGADMEQALIDGKASFDRTQADGDTVFVLTDGMAEALVAMAMASKITGDGNHPRKVVAVPNPYPVMSLYLGSFYDDIGKYEDGIRVIDLGMRLRAESDLRLGDSLPLLIAERGAALNGLKRWDDSLANYDDGLKITGMSDENRARLFRGRGFALTELGRLDDAEEAYKNALKLKPDDARSQNELKYIARLRAGGLAEPGTISLPPKSQ